MRGGGVFTKSAISFAGKSFLVAAFFPGLLFAGQVHPQHAKAKKAAKNSVIRTTELTKQTATRLQAKQQKSQQIKNTRWVARSAMTQLTPLDSHSLTTEKLSLGRFTLRAYTQYRSSTENPSRTATGTVPDAGRTIAVDPRLIPFGTRLYIEGLGERIAEDSGARIKGKRLDVFFPSVEHCREFGVQTRDVVVLTE
jgi:3D (Asp-Asp-Asp) domain-containing protein